MRIIPLIRKIDDFFLVLEKCMAQRFRPARGNTYHLVVTV